MATRPHTTSTSRASIPCKLVRRNAIRRASEETRILARRKVTEIILTQGADLEPPPSTPIVVRPIAESGHYQALHNALLQVVATQREERNHQVCGVDVGPDNATATGWGEPDIDVVGAEPSSDEDKAIGGRDQQAARSSGTSLDCWTTDSRGSYEQTQAAARFWVATRQRAELRHAPRHF